MLVKLAKAIGYPDPVPDDCRLYGFHTDGSEIIAEKIAGRLILKRLLDFPSEHLVRFAQFTAGRILREDIVLAWDERRESAFIWQEIPPDADPSLMRRIFEDFADSCDWWTARANEVDIPPAVFPDIMIRP